MSGEELLNEQSVRDWDSSDLHVPSPWPLLVVFVVGVLFWATVLLWLIRIWVW